jgi:hypothetical protein
MLIGTLPALLTADTITYKNAHRQTETIEVNVIHETDQGDLLAESADGRQWTFRREEIQSRIPSEKEIPLWGRDELVKALQKEYPSGFEVLQTKHYIVVYSTSEPFARDVGKLFEKIKSVFENAMEKQVGIRPKPLRQPMIAIVFGNQQEYIRAMQPQLGSVAKTTAGVYMPQDNRLYLFDMLGGRDAEWFRKASAASVKSPDEITLLLASDTVSTVIHEGVHQIAYNTGFHDRNVRQPLWLVEGLATLLEVPDMDAKNRWAGMGQINWDRAEELKRDWAKVSPESLEKLINTDGGFRSAGESGFAYAQAWGLTYFLTKAKKEEYRDFIDLVNRRPPMVEYNPEDRRRDFESAFGKSPAQLEAEFRRYIERSVFRKERPAPSGGIP